MKLLYRVILFLLLPALAGCNLLNQPAGSPPNPQATIEAAVQASAVAQGGGTASRAAALPTSAASTAAPATAAPATPAPIQGTQRFGFSDLESRSDQNALQRVVLVLRGAELTQDTLTLRVAFQNTSDEGFSLIGGATGQSARLTDNAGTEYEPSSVSKDLSGSINPEGGFAPGSANVGTISFPRPSGEGPFTFRFPSFDPISFRLDTPLTAADTVTVATGSYQVNEGVRSSESALRQIELRVTDVKVSDDTLEFAVEFVNTDTRRGYDLMLGPKGEDMRLLDAEGRQYKPTEVSESLRESIAPKDGWLPGQAYGGSFTFPRPEAMEELRLVFPLYDALSMRFDATGLAEARVTSATGGAPQPTATPTAEESLASSLNTLLKTQGDAVTSGQVDAFLNTFAPELRDEQRGIFERMRQMPFVSYTLELEPGTNLPGSDTSELRSIEVELRYTLRDINPNNVFLHTFRYDFVREGRDWRISEVNVDDLPPFWFNGDVVLRETPHFLLFGRPEASAELAEVEQEAETAYSTLQQRGFTLEPRYVAFFLNNLDDFAKVTDNYEPRVLGLAISRYQLTSDKVQAISRAFYINGGAFEQAQGTSIDRQTTVTHELVHLALAEYSMPFTPPWVVEGMAVYYAEQLGPDQRQQQLGGDALNNVDLMKLTRASTLGEHDILGQQVGAEYIFSGEAVAYLITQFGEEKVLEFYQAYAAVPAGDIASKMPSFGTAFANKAAFADISEQQTKALLKQFFNLTLEELDAQVKAEIRK
ncbi:MAG: hypothetical protein MUD01_21710 [Chloroflexaceae bacterium]|nr:hypothetical protein [Chloroflexaceae bacterium]